MHFVAGYAVASLIAMAVAGALLSATTGLPPANAAILSLGAGNSNSIFLGFPIALAVMPDLAERMFAWVIFAENLIVIPLGLAAATLLTRSHGSGEDDHRQPPSLLVRLGALTLRNPVFLGLLAGLAFSSTSLALPEVIDRTRLMIVAAAPAVALFIIGGTIARARLSELGPAVIAVPMVKLLIHPLLVFAALAYLVPVTPDVLAGAVLFAAMPMITIFVIFADPYGEGARAASALVVATLASAVTVAAVVALLFAPAA